MQLRPQTKQNLQIKVPAVMAPGFAGQYRYRVFHGGRGSGKTRTCAKMSAVRALWHASQGHEGIILCGREFMNSLDESTFAEVKAAIMSEPLLAQYFDCGDKYIRTRDKKVEFKFAGLSRNLDSIKSKFNILLLWIDEAEPVSEAAYRKIIPSVRAESDENDETDWYSELWISYNPESKRSATHKRFRDNPPENSIVIQVNYTDNPWFPRVLEMERLEDQKKRPDQYGHVWEGDFATAIEGAYFAKGLALCRKQKRIGRVGADPLMTKYAVFDIGGTGAKADAVAIWVVQFIGREIRVLDYYEAVGQPLEVHLAWLREKGYEKAQIILPHDGKQNDKVYKVSYESAIRDAQFSVKVIPNQGAGAAMQRVEAARRIFPLVWFNKKTTEAGREALGHYHENKDDIRDIGLGPNHDWSSHGADAFGLMAVIYKAPVKKDTVTQPEQGSFV